MRHFIPLTLLLACLTPATSQAEKPMSDKPVDASYLRDHAQTGGFQLGRPVRARPAPDGKSVLFLRSPPRLRHLHLYEYDVDSGKTRLLLTPEQVLHGAAEQLSAEEKARRERQRIGAGGFTQFHLSDDGTQVLVSLSGKLYLLTRATGAVLELKTGPGVLQSPQLSPDGKSLAYVLDHDLYVLDLATQKERRLTHGGTVERSHGLAEFVAQEEMQRFAGFWWAPDSRSLAYEEADADGVEKWYVADPIHPDQHPHASYYPRPGKDNVRVRLAIVAATGGEPTWIDWDRNAYPYLGSVHWEKQGPLTITVQKRTQTEQLLLRVDPETGRTSILVDERDAGWINLHHDGPRWLDDGSFLWTGESPAGTRLEWREKNGELRRVLAGPDEGYLSMVDLDRKAHTVVYHASPDPTQTQLMRLSLEGGKPTPLNRKPGLHDAVFSRRHDLYVVTSSGATAMPTSTVHRGDGTVVGTLPSVAEEPPFVPQSEYLRSGGERNFSCVIVRPHGFERGKRYPVVLHVYGGPGHLQVMASMASRLLDQWLADQGFLVVSLDNRGTPGRGRDWEKAISRRFGTVPLEDQVEGLKQLGQRFPELDLERVGIHGWSFGGYLAAQAVLRRPDVFKAAIAGAPVTDWLDYDTHYTERYLGLPETDAAAYQEASLLTYAAQLRRPLLLLHGTADDNVYFRHTLKLSDALFRAGKDFEVLPLSGLTHMVPDPVVMERLYLLQARFFQRHLGRPE
jgi:dipeptidyl-peptidase-4